jgi:hypothetical protein
LRWSDPANSFKIWQLAEICLEDIKFLELFLPLRF